MKKYNIRKKMLSENGGAAVLVFFTVFTFLIVGMGAFMTVSTLRKSQLESDIQIQEIYGKDVSIVDEVYDELLTKYAKYDEPYIPAGFTHIGTEDWNSGYRISDTGDETGNIFVWVPCVLDQAKVKNGDTVQTFQKTTTGKYNSYPFGLSPTDTSVTDEEPTNAIRTSVGKYGGFYIAAYEAGVPLDNDGNEVTATSATTSQKARSVTGATTWTNITRANAITAAENMITTTSDGIKSGLISGECWDTTLQWMVNSSTNATTNSGYDTNSAGKGWHSDVSGDAKHTTGYYAVNNIYDMAGNVWEWTTENCVDDDDNSGLVSRGGSYFYSGSVIPVAYRSGGDDFASTSIAFRVVLYKDV